VNFPRLAEWIEEEIPRCRYDTKIWQAFVKWGQFTHNPHLAEQALAHNGLPPTIDVAVMDDLGQYRGEIRKRHYNKVLIGRKWARKFNKVAKDRDQLGPNWDLFMKANILHEMVHWADWTGDHSVQPNANVWDRAHQVWWYDADVGFQFEEDAFYGIYSEEYVE
jgi:hypothetical protein